MSFAKYTFVNNAFLLNDFWCHDTSENSEDDQGAQDDQTWVTLTNSFPMHHCSQTTQRFSNVFRG